VFSYSSPYFRSSLHDKSMIVKIQHWNRFKEDPWPWCSRSFLATPWEDGSK
jgi:hypothetical protein